MCPGSRAATRTDGFQNRCDAMAHRGVSCVWQKGVIWVVSARSLTLELYFQSWLDVKQCPCGHWFNSCGPLNIVPHQICFRTRQTQQRPCRVHHCFITMWMRANPSMLSSTLDSTVSKCSPQVYISVQTNLQITTMLQSHVSSHCAGG